MPCHIQIVPSYTDELWNSETRVCRLYYIYIYLYTVYKYILYVYIYYYKYYCLSLNFMTRNAKSSFHCTSLLSIISPCLLVLITLEFLMHNFKYFWQSGAQDDFFDERIKVMCFFLVGWMNIAWECDCLIWSGCPAGISQILFRELFLL